MRKKREPIDWDAREREARRHRAVILLGDLDRQLEDIRICYCGDGQVLPEAILQARSKLAEALRDWSEEGAGG